MKDTSLLEDHVLETLRANCKPGEAVIVLAKILLKLHEASSMEDDGMSLAEFVSNFKLMMDSTVKQFGKPK